MNNLTIFGEEEIRKVTPSGLYFLAMLFLEMEPNSKDPKKGSEYERIDKEWDYLLAKERPAVKMVRKKDGKEIFVVDPSMTTDVQTVIAALLAIRQDQIDDEREASQEEYEESRVS